MNNSEFGKQKQRAYQSDSISFQLSLIKNIFLVQLSVALMSQGIVLIVFFPQQLCGDKMQKQKGVLHQMRV